ncbi:MAG: tRNA-dihydrouridine synthase [Anaerolineales bacterium]|nr:tRNA-dihydrouridine synthase [Anaerolineales bacterium]
MNPPSHPRRPSPAAFAVREIPIHGDVILAPMDGFSDLPFRLLCRELGSAMSYTEFVNVDELAATRKRDAKCWRKLEFHPSERPMTFQIYGHDVDRLVAVARRLQDRPPAEAPDILDINLGCYVKSISERGAGSGMLRCPDKLETLFKRLTAELRLPVTGKMRLGWDEHSRHHVDNARRLEDNGASLIAVHGRTKSQGYGGQADWDAIAEVKQAVRVPVVGNGDVRTVADIARIKAHTGCDGVMIGRAAIGNPWIFAGLDREQVPLEARIALMRRHLALNLEFYGPRFGLLLFRKHAARYIRDLPGEALLRVPLLTADSLAEFDRWLAQAGEPAALPA